jgi:hypothetical protein
MALRANGLKMMMLSSAKRSKRMTSTRGLWDGTTTQVISNRLFVYLSGFNIRQYGNCYTDDEWRTNLNPSVKKKKNPRLTTCTQVKVTER